MFLLNFIKETYSIDLVLDLDVKDLIKSVSEANNENFIKDLDHFYQKDQGNFLRSYRLTTILFEVFRPR